MLERRDTQDCDFCQDRAAEGLEPRIKAMLIDGISHEEIMRRLKVTSETVSHVEATLLQQRRGY